jgi:hypothetical protein
MLNLSNDVFKIFSKYLSGDVNIGQFRDYMVGLRIEKYRLLADADRLFLNEFEGRYAEFSDFDGDEALLKASLASYIQADVPAAVPASSLSWALQSEKPTGTYSVNFGSPAPTFNFTAAVVGSRS